MDGRANDSAERLGQYLDYLAEGLGDARRTQPMVDYCTGLLSSCERKSVEPMAAATAPAAASAQHQSLLHFVATSPWDDAAILARVREKVLPEIERHGAISVWIVDETSFPKHGPHSVGVAHQYCGQLGKQANCQVAVSLTLANGFASLPVAWQLYLPQKWAESQELREKCGIPDDIKFATKPKIALAQIERALELGLPRGVVLGDTVYGVDLSLRQRCTERGLTYALAVQSRTVVVAIKDDGREPAVPVQAAALARSLPKRGWRTISWRDGTNAKLTSRFQRVRVRAAGAGTNAEQPAEWLLVEWPKGEKEPAKFWLSTLPEDYPLERMVDIVMMRWKIERDFLELKQEVGLGHYEGRGWRGFHHHATMCIATYGFLIFERSAFPPSAARRPAFLEAIAVPEGHRPRGAAAPA